MSATFRRLLELVERNEIRISAHGYDELSDDGILARDVIAGVLEAIVVEDCPDYRIGPSVLVLQRDQIGDPVRVVRGIPEHRESPAVLVTSYRPDPERWSVD